MNKSRHLAVDFVTEDKALKLVNDPRFMTLEEFSGSCYEVRYTKRTNGVYKTSTSIPTGTPTSIPTDTRTGTLIGTSTSTPTDTPTGTPTSH